MPQPNPSWNFVQFGTPEDDFAVALTSDNQGNIFLAGNTNGKIGNNNQKNQFQDGFLAKINEKAQINWIKQFGTDYIDEIHAITVSDNTLTMIGNAANPTDPGQDKDILLASFDTNGQQKWIKHNKTELYELGEAVTTTKNGQTLIAGATFPDALGAHMYLAEVNQNGQITKDKTFPTDAYDLIRDIKFDQNSGEIYVVGSTAGDLGGINTGSFDVFSGKLHSDWSIKSIQQTGTDDVDLGLGMIVDKDHNIYVLAASFSDLKTKKNENDGINSVFLIKYDTNGQQKWMTRIGDGKQNVGTSLIIDRVGNIYVGGYTKDSLVGQNKGNHDAFIAKFDQNGEQKWLKQFGTTEDDFITSILITPDNKLIIAGITDGDLAGHHGKKDAFLAYFDNKE